MKFMLFPDFIPAENPFVYRLSFSWDRVYLGYTKLPGSQLRYIDIAYANNQIVACFGFGAAAWKTAPRDKFIGWNEEQRKANLHLIVNNVRFLILPWVNSKNLASKLLSMVSNRLPAESRDNVFNEY